MSYHHLSAEERTSILYCSQDGLSGREIARSLGRSLATISRELRRGKPIWSAFYNDYYAHHQALVRRHRARHRRRADQARLRAYVHNKLGACWSPRTIANRLMLDYPSTTTMRISAEPVYQWVFADARSGGTLYRALRRAHRGRRRQGRLARAKRGIRDRIGIEQRPAVVARRVRFGDWEGDTIALEKVEKGKGDATLYRDKWRINGVGLD